MEALQLTFLCRPAEDVGPELIGCRLVKRRTNGSLLWGAVVETEAYSQDELMKRTKMSKSGCYKQALLEYHARLTQSAVIR